MAVAAEGSPNAVSYVFIVGGEDFVFRECKRRLLKMGVNVTGHASYRWKNADFVVPKLSTAILVITDECRNDMRARAHDQAKQWEIPVVEAPAREHWGKAEEALRHAGVIEGRAGIVAIGPTIRPAPRTTLGEAIAAKGEKLEMPVAPAPAKAGKGKDAQRALILQFLTECKGKAGNIPIAKLVAKETGAVCDVRLVAKVRKEAKIPTARPGALSQEQVAFYAKYGIETKQAAMVGGIHARRRKAVAHPRPESVAAVESSDEVEVFRGVVRYLDEALVQRLHLTSLTLKLENGKWHEPEFERVQVTKGRVKLK